MTAVAYSSTPLPLTTLETLRWTRTTSTTPVSGAVTP